MSKWCNECHRNKMIGKWEDCNSNCPAFGLHDEEMAQRIVEQDTEINRLRKSIKETLNRFVLICKTHSYYPADTYKGMYERRVVDADDIDMELKKMLEELK